MKNLIFILTILCIEPGTALGDADFDSYQKSVEEKFSNREKDILQTWDSREASLKKIWGSSFIEGKEKVYFEYAKDSLSRLKVDYETGTVEVNILSEKPLSNSEALKVFRKEVSTAISSKDMDGQAVLMKEEVPSKSEIFSSLTGPALEEKSSLKGNDGIERHDYKITFRMLPAHLLTRAKAYLPLVKTWSEKYGLDSSFVLGVIAQESAFNPRAKSYCAYGLMQIVPKFAGREVIKKISNRDASPSPEVLFDPEKNIMFGTTYLQILRDDHFSKIEAGQVKDLFLTAAYNGGPDRILKAINSGTINPKESSSLTISKLLPILPSETKGYVRAVTSYREQFKRSGL